MHRQHALVGVLRGNHRGAHRFAYCMELVVTGDLLDDAAAILLEQHEVPHVVQKQFGLEKAADHCFQLHLKARAIVFVGDGAPRQHALRVGGERADTSCQTIAHHQGDIAVEQVADLVLVGLQLLEGIPHIRLRIGGVLQLDDGQRQAIHEDDHVGPARLLGAGDGELVDHQEVVVAGLHEVDAVRQVGLFLIALRELHQHTVQQQPMHAAVAHHPVRLADRLQRVGGLLQCRGREVGVDAGQGRQQALPQHHLPMVGALWRVAVRRDVRAVGDTPAGLLEPAQAEVFELLFVHGTGRNGRLSGLR